MYAKNYFLSFKAPGTVNIHAKWTFRWMWLCKIRLLIGSTIESAEML